MPYDANDPETKAAVKAAVDAALEEAEAEHETAIEGLKNKNKQLTGQIKQLKAGTPAEGDAEEISKLEAEVADNKAKLRDVEKALRSTTRERDELKTNYETESNFSRNLVVENGLTSALVEAKVAPQFIEAAKAMLGKQVTVKTDGDNRVPVINDKPLGEFVKEWSASEAGKHFVAAPANGGGGGNGAGQGGGSTKKLSDMTEQERLDMARTNPTGWQAILASEQSTA